MNTNAALNTAGDITAPIDLLAEFHGQQEGERVLYSFSPHPIGTWLRLLKPTIYTLALVWVAYFLSKFLGTKVANLSYISNIFHSLAAVGWIAAVWWRFKYQKLARTFITDRRIVRFEPTFPGISKKRALFWTNGFKCKAIPAMVPLRFFKLGTLKITPNLGSDEDITCEYVSYCDDLANYIDKILFCVKHTPLEMQSLRAFVKKPRGQRY
jgi:hypothetical protein